MVKVLDRRNWRLARRSRAENRERLSLVQQREIRKSRSERWRKVFHYGVIALQSN